MTSPVALATRLTRDLEPNIVGRCMFDQLTNITASTHKNPFYILYIIYYILYFIYHKKNILYYIFYILYYILYIIYYILYCIYIYIYIM